MTTIESTIVNEFIDYNNVIFTVVMAVPNFSATVPSD